MERPKIVRLFAKADRLELEFTHEGGTIWMAKVPPDTQDGIYAVELTAVNEIGETAFWTGELYMCGGECKAQFESADFVLWFLPFTSLAAKCKSTSVKVDADTSRANFLNCITKLLVKRGV